MLNSVQLTSIIARGRVNVDAVQGDPILGPLARLPGIWKSKGHGWNMIALPHSTAPNGFRLLLNQYDENLTFGPKVISGVQNRGILTDQHLVAMQYVQDVTQVASKDSIGSLDTPDTPKGIAPIHHEPGLFMHLGTPVSSDPSKATFDLARLATIPHGDSVLAMGSATAIGGDNPIPDFDAPMLGDYSSLPLGASPRDLSNPYMKAYANFNISPFLGNVTTIGFPGFDPTNPKELLKLAIRGQKFKNVTAIVLDTQHNGGIVNIPFVVEQANASEMRSVFWIEELFDSSAATPRFQLQYLQRAVLEFFKSKDGPGLIKWPHISINTLELQP
jgi:hypothetical protein